MGADDAHKQEIDPALIAASRVVADNLEQCCSIGDTHHAIAQGLMREEDVYAELSEIVAGHKVGRTSEMKPSFSIAPAWLLKTPWRPPPFTESVRNADRRAPQFRDVTGCGKPESTGLEPATSAVTGRRSNQLS